MVVANKPASIWNIPYQRNPFFTGREEVLDALYRGLQANNAVILAHPLGISGLGGIGKTQTALEYAYRYREDYAAVCWVRADSTVALLASFMQLAHVLDLPLQNERNQDLVVKEVLSWFHHHEGWLLIFDNIEDLRVAEPFLPKIGQGHMIFTTRAHALAAIAQLLEVEKMEPETGALLLLRRASMIPLQATLDLASPEDCRVASIIVQELDGLPLALDQAGAYIKETPCSLQEYLTLYRNRRFDLLQKRGSFEKDYPASVATTWSLSFEKVTQADAAATELLEFVAFLAADNIPEKLLIEGHTYLGKNLAKIVEDPLALNTTISTLLAYSLVRRDPDSTVESSILSIHRLVQTVLRDTMQGQEREMWRLRAVQAVGQTFPNVLFNRWRLCDLWLPHAQICIDYIRQDSIQNLEAAQLLNQAGVYMQRRGRFTEAETPLLLALTMMEQLVGEDEVDITRNLNNLAEFYRFQSDYVRAEQLHARALDIRKRKLGDFHPLVAESLNNLAFVYRAGGGYVKAEPLQQQALEIRKKTLGAEHPDVAISLDTMAGLFRAMGRYPEAEPYYKEALRIRELALDKDHPYVAISFNNLAGYYRALEKFEDARRWYEQALELRKRALGTEEHPDVAITLHGLAEVHTELKNYEEAERLYDRALHIKEQKQGSDTWDVARMLNGKAILYVELGKYEEAEALYRRSLAIWRKTPGIVLAEEESSLKSVALEVWEKVLGLHTDVARSLEHLATLYKVQGAENEIEPLLLRALQIRGQILGSDHLSLAHSLEILAQWYQFQGRREEAEPLLQRMKVINAQILDS